MSHHKTCAIFDPKTGKGSLPPIEFARDSAAGLLRFGIWVPRGNVLFFMIWEDGLCFNPVAWTVESSNAVLRFVIPLEHLHGTELYVHAFYGASAIDGA